MPTPGEIVAATLGPATWDRANPATHDRAWFALTRHRLINSIGWFLEYRDRPRGMPAILAMRCSHIHGSGSTDWFETRAAAVAWVEAGYQPAMDAIAHAVKVGIRVGLSTTPGDRISQFDLERALRRAA